MKINQYNLFIFILLLHVSSIVEAQESYPQNYFRDPLNIPIQLAANFGELRQDHFHMGLDIRTQSRENLPVFAAADGYISHIRIEKYGYGKAIFIRHSNGYTTVYGHLNSFYDTLEKYLVNKQYKDESWEQDFDLPANRFPVFKGQFIANSGNTGGSQGPHLHFEIRNTKTGDNINPLLFGLHVPDNIPPVIYSLFWYNRRYSIYTVDAQPIPIIKKYSSYITQNKIVKVGSPSVGLGIRIEDVNNTSSFRYGVNHAALYKDDSLLFEFKLNEFSYDSSRYVNACMDYGNWIKNKQGIQYLFVLPGNQLNIFTPLKSDGTILLNDASTHKIKIVISDEHQNISTINFLLQYDSSIKKDYALPLDAIVCLPGEENNVETPHAQLHFDENAFYDALPFAVFETPSKNAKQVSPTIHVGAYTIPVHDDYDIAIKTDVALNNALKNKTVIQLQSGNSSSVINGKWKGDWMQGSFDELGEVRLLIDTTGPEIIPVGWKPGSIAAGKNLTVTCKDDLSKIKTFTARLDGNWLMFAKKNDYFTYNFDAHCSNGTHTLTITASDVAGNITSRTFNFIR